MSSLSRVIHRRTLPSKGYFQCDSPKTILISCLHILKYIASCQTSSHQKVSPLLSTTSSDDLYSSKAGKEPGCINRSSCSRSSRLSSFTDFIEDGSRDRLGLETVKRNIPFTYSPLPSSHTSAKASRAFLVEIQAAQYTASFRGG